MKKILVLVLALLSFGFYLVKASSVEKIKLKLDDQIGIAFLNPNVLLIISDDESTLLVLNKDKLNKLNTFKYRNLNVLMLKDNLINIDAKQTIVLDDKYEIDDVKYLKQDGLIYINYENLNFCISMGNVNNISSCQVIYFYNTDVNNIHLYEYNELVIYDYKKPLPTNILEKIYEESIDTQLLRDDTITIIKLGEEDYELIVIDDE